MMSGSVRMGKGSSESGSTRSSRFRFLSWSPETHVMREFLAAFPLPRVVRLTNGDEATLLRSLGVLPPDVEPSQPLLFYRKYKPTKVLAKSLKVTANKGGKWKETGGPPLLIPDSFPGWFTLLNQDGKECAMTLTSMGQVAAARVPAFLTKFDVPVYKLTDSNEPGSKSVYVRSNMKAGSVLRLLGVWADLGGPKGFQHQKPNFFSGGSLGAFGGRLVARSLSLQGSAGPPQPLQYVQCLNLDNEVLFIPFTATGVFYPIAPRGGRNPQHIYPLGAIAKIHRLPLRTKMVYGALPANLPDFTGTLEVEGVESEEVILACTLLREKPLLFELSMEVVGDLTLTQMASEDLFIQSTSYQAAIAFCKAEGDSWRRQIRPSTGWKGKNTTHHHPLLTVKEKAKSSWRLAKGSSPSASKLSLLFKPSGGGGKDALRRSKSFNVEVQSVSISLTQDSCYEEEDESHPTSGRKLSLFNLLGGGKGKNEAHPRLEAKQSLQLPPPPTTPKHSESLRIDFCPPQRNSQNKSLQSIFNPYPYHSHHYPGCPVNKPTPPTPPDVLLANKANNKKGHIRELGQRQQGGLLSVHSGSNTGSSNSSSGVSSSGGGGGTGGRGNGGDVPYGTVLDEVGEEENIYAEIGDALTLKLRLGNFHHHSRLLQTASPSVSLLKGGSDGFSGTFSGTFSSSNPSSREDEDIYDAVF